MARIQKSERELTLTYSDCDIIKKVDVHYVYTPGLPELGPNFSSGGQPAEPPEVEILHVYLLEEWTPIPPGSDIIKFISNADFERLTEELLGDTR